MIYLCIYLYTIYYDIYTGPEQASAHAFLFRQPLMHFSSGGVKLCCPKPQLVCFRLYISLEDPYKFIYMFDALVWTGIKAMQDCSQCAVLKRSDSLTGFRMHLSEASHLETIMAQLLYCSTRPSWQSSEGWKGGGGTMGNQVHAYLDGLLVVASGQRRSGRLSTP
jgi:hypothetical protein